MSHRNVVNCLRAKALGQFCSSQGDHPVNRSVLGAGVIESGSYGDTAKFTDAHGNTTSVTCVVSVRCWPRVQSGVEP